MTIQIDKPYFDPWNFHTFEVWFTDQDSKPLETEDKNKHHFSYQLKCKI